MSTLTTELIREVASKHVILPPEGWKFMPEGLVTFSHAIEQLVNQEAQAKADMQREVITDLEDRLEGSQARVAELEKAIEVKNNALHILRVRCGIDNEDGSPNLANAVRPAPVSETASQSHQWGDDGERCLKCGDKDWMAGSVCSGNAGSPIPEHSTVYHDFLKIIHDDSIAVGDRLQRLSSRINKLLSPIQPTIAASPVTGSQVGQVRTSFDDAGVKVTHWAELPPAPQQTDSLAQVRDAITAIDKLHDTAMSNYRTSRSQYDEGFADGVETTQQLLQSQTSGHSTAGSDGL